MVIAAPAKVNLYLKVIARLSDGYHEIDTLFERISILDYVSVEIARHETTITSSDPRIPTDITSLLARTAGEFSLHSRDKRRFKVNLEKNIPIGAGLGGGSSDAASLLLGLNEITGFPLSKEELYDIGRSLGADIPFFLANTSFAHGSGRGDIIQDMGKPMELGHIVVNPPFEVLTRDVYAKLDPLSLTNDTGIARMFSAFLKENNIRGLAGNLCNDLQQGVLQNFPVLGEVFLALREEGAEGVLLSGSGPTVFGICDKNLADKIAEKVRQRFPPDKAWRVFAAKTY